MLELIDLFHSDSSSVQFLDIYNDIMKYHFNIVNFNKELTLSFLKSNQLDDFVKLAYMKSYYLNNVEANNKLKAAWPFEDVKTPSLEVEIEKNVLKNLLTFQLLLIQEERNNSPSNALKAKLHSNVERLLILSGVKSVKATTYIEAVDILIQNKNRPIVLLFDNQDFLSLSPIEIKEDDSEVVEGFEIEDETSYKSRKRNFSG